MSRLKSEYEKRWAELAGGEEVRDVLVGERLVPTGYTDCHDPTYFVDGHPNMLIRRNHELDLNVLPFKQTLKIADAFNRLGKFGVNCLPYIPVEADGIVYVATENVVGENLESSLEWGSDPAGLDKGWEGLGEYYLDAWRKRLPYASDITGCRQYMVGKAGFDPVDRTWLVDLSDLCADFGGGKVPGYKKTRFESEIWGFYGYATDVIRIEGCLGSEMTRSRQKIAEMLAVTGFDSMPKDDYLSKREVLMMLDSGEVPEEDDLAYMKV
jgi:hypothetical protein